MAGSRGTTRRVLLACALAVVPAEMQTAEEGNAIQVENEKAGRAPSLRPGGPAAAVAVAN